MAEVSGVDTARKMVQTDAPEVPYDYLVLATGSKYNYFGHEEWEKDAPSLKTLADALNIRQRILLAYEAAELVRDPEARRALLTFVLVGGGPTGVEMAGTMAELSRMALRRDFRSIHPEETRILLVEAGPRILASFPGEAFIRGPAGAGAARRGGADRRAGGDAWMRTAQS